MGSSGAYPAQSTFTASLAPLPQIKTLSLIFLNVSWVDPERLQNFFSRVLDAAFFFAKVTKASASPSLFERQLLLGL
jgi:hypothetical protein